MSEEQKRELIEAFIAFLEAEGVHITFETIIEDVNACTEKDIDYLVRRFFVLNPIARR